MHTTAVESADRLHTYYAGISGLGSKARDLHFRLLARCLQRGESAVPLAIVECLAQSTRPYRLINQLVAQGIWIRDAGCVTMCSYDLLSPPQPNPPAQPEPPVRRVDSTPIISEDFVVRPRTPPNLLDGEVAAILARRMGQTAEDVQARVRQECEAEREAYRRQEASLAERHQRECAAADCDAPPDADDSRIAISEAVKAGNCHRLPYTLPPADLARWRDLKPTVGEIHRALGYLDGKPQARKSWGYVLWHVGKQRADVPRVPEPAPRLQPAGDNVTRVLAGIKRASADLPGGDNAHEPPTTPYRTAGTDHTRELVG